MTKDTPKRWEDTMNLEEVQWCLTQIANKIAEIGDEACCNDNWRAARLWKYTQRRRFARYSKSGCCGSCEWVGARWSWKKMRFDKYLLGFNYGH